MSNTNSSGQAMATSQRPITEAEPSALPTELSSATAKLVYLYLDAAGAASPHEMREHLDVNLLTLYPILDTLQTGDLVARDDGVYRTTR